MKVLFPFLSFEEPLDYGKQSDHCQECNNTCDCIGRHILSLYKDKSINRYNATLIFTTHYCEVLDLFNRQDNIWISTANRKVSLSNMYDAHELDPKLLKGKRFYNNAFQSSVNYENLMRLKKVLMHA